MKEVEEKAEQKKRDEQNTEQAEREEREREEKERKVIADKTENPHIVSLRVGRFVPFDYF